MPALVDRISADIGEPTNDSGWQPMPDEWACIPETSFRTVWWDDFRMTFEGDGSGDASVSGWSVGDPLAAFAPLGDAPNDPPGSGVGVGVSPGIGIGASRADVLAAAPAGGMLSDEADRVIYAGALPLVFLIDGSDEVTGIGSGRLDCIDESGDL